MHEPVKSQLEDLLQGRLGKEQRESIHSHLLACPPCAQELQDMRACAAAMNSLRSMEAPDQAAGFYARVMKRIEAEDRPSFWNLLLDPVFGRRLVYGTGALLLLMASFLLATTNEQTELARSPVEMMAKPPVSPSAMQAQFGEDVGRDREHFLVNMASFSE